MTIVFSWSLSFLIDNVILRLRFFVWVSFSSWLLALLLPLTPSIQFLLRSASHEREVMFQMHKQRAELLGGSGRGSIYAFFGAPSFSWFDILMLGLKSVNGTSQVINGEDYGGVYPVPVSICSSCVWEKKDFITHTHMHTHIAHAHARTRTPIAIVSGDSIHVLFDR